MGLEPYHLTLDVNVMGYFCHCSMDRKARCFLGIGYLAMKTPHFYMKLCSFITDKFYKKKKKNN